MKEAKEIKPRKQRKPTRSVVKKKQKKEGWPEDLRWAEPTPEESDDARHIEEDRG